MITFVSGNLLQAQEMYLAQGVAEDNQEGLGTGLALKISQRWPEVQKSFKRYVRTRPFRGGDIWVCPPTPERPGFIYLATQPDMYHATLPYLRKAVRRLAQWAEKQRIPSVALPKIGAGLGKLSWEKEVKSLLVENLQAMECQFVVYETFTSTME